MELLVIFGLAALGIGAYAIVDLLAKIPGLYLRWKISRLGELKERSLKEIVAALGPPACVVVDNQGKNLYQWIATGYHVVVRFEGETCEGLTHVITD